MRRIPIISLKSDVTEIAQTLGLACEDFGFFCVSDHGISLDLQSRLEKLSQQFFALPLEQKMAISMDKGGPAWRGFFPVGGELTSGKPDLKEGLYFGEELSAEHPKVREGLPLHGANLFPSIPGFRETVLEYMAQMTDLSHRLMGFISLSLGLREDFFFANYTNDPTLLFRIFHYPPVNEENRATHPWGVGTHTDYGLLTILKQDDCGGLEVYSKKEWLAVPPMPDTLVCNIGDMLDYLTGGRYLSTPHRVRNTSGKERYSYPFFFDPGFAAPIKKLPHQPKSTSTRWDNADLYQFQGSYGEYLVGKVSKVFPTLATNKL
jgi:isopenicillin N synthase-like dioxygenase